MLDMARVLGLSESVDGELFQSCAMVRDSSEVFDIRQYRRGDLLPQLSLEAFRKD